MSELFPTIDEFECPHYKCFDCKYYKPRHQGGCQHRFDNTKMQYAFTFNSCQEEIGRLCADFEPNGNYKAALPYWHGMKHYLEWKREQEIEDLIDCGFSDTMILERLNCTHDVVFELNQEPNVRYYVPYALYYNGKMWLGKRLLAYHKGYYKRSKISHGIQLYDWVIEDINGVIVE